MKKIITIMMAVCLMVSVFCVSAFAADEPSADTVIRVSGLKEDGSLYYPENCDYKNFADGWEAAVDYAANEDWMDDHDVFRVVVDFYADWNANSIGEFGKSSWTGFQYSTIYVPSNVRMTVNLNGHTINRGLKEYEYDGEVICINDDADVIINGGKSGDPIIEPDKDPGDVKMGTITGGFSRNGAGGIHMQDGSRLTLNNVNIVGNKIADDEGAGIAVYDGAILTMNGGCVSYNTSYGAVYGGGVYVDEASAFLTDVTFQDNQGVKRSIHGAAVYVDDGTLEMDGCKVIGNGLMKTAGGDTCWGAYSIIDVSNGSKVTIKETKLLENGYAQETYASYNTLKYTAVISSTASYLTLEKCTLADNNQVYLILSEATVLNALDSDFTGNHSFAFYGNCAAGFNSAFTNCQFSYNEPMLKLDDTFFFNLSNAGLSFVDCDLGDATFNNKSAAQFVDTKNPVGKALLTSSLFGDGSLTMIVAILAILALIASVVAIGFCVTLRKKITVPVAANNAAEDKEDEE